MVQVLSKAPSLRTPSASLASPSRPRRFVRTHFLSSAAFVILRYYILSVVASSVIDNLLAPAVSGILGLGFETISSLDAPPFWQALYNANVLAEPLFGFYLQRWITYSTLLNSAPGGTLTLGGTNSSFYTGEIEYINMPSGATPSYWLQQISSESLR